MSGEADAIADACKMVNGGMTRYEFEKEITMDEAQHLPFPLSQGGVPLR